MEYLVSGLAIFIIVHLVPTQVSFRERLIGRLGKAQYRILYSVISAVGLVLIIVGYRVAPSIEIWQPPYWMRHVTLLLMLPVFPLLVGAFVPGRLRATFPHPMLLAVKIWALAHLLANGDLASIFLFGGILLWAVFDRISFKKRDAILGRPLIVGPQRNDWFALIAGLVIYAYFVIGDGHALLIGVPLAAVSV